MNKDNQMKKALLETLKLQPIVVLYSLVSVGSKLASRQIPEYPGNLWDFMLRCLQNYRLILIFATMFLILGIYAVLWQRCIKRASISVMYANKSSYMFWTQVAAVVIFHESLNGCNVIGILLIFLGIMVVNSDDKE